MPEGQITDVAVVEESWPTVHLAYAVGKDGTILHIHGDVGMWVGGWVCNWGYL